MADADRTASLMSPARLAQMKPLAPVTPAAWLNQMAADAGHQHVKRIEELGAVLQQQAISPELAAVASQLQRLSAALPQLDFSLLEPPGWWARTFGRGRSGGVGFTAGFEQIAGAAKPLAGLASAMRQERQADTALAERALVELAVEYRAVEKIIDQAARWLQDMRNQLKVRQMAAADAQVQRQVLEDSRRCDILVDRLKLLRTLCNAASQVHEQAKANAESRIALARTLEQSLASDLKEWHERIAALAGAASAGNGPALGVQGPMDLHENLQTSISKAIAACDALMEQEQAFGRSLALLIQQQAPAA